MNKIKYAIYAGIESLILIPLGIFCLFSACVYFAWENYQLNSNIFWTNIYDCYN